MKTKQTIGYKPVSPCDKKLLEYIEETYLSSFPISERRDFELVKNLLVGNPAFKINALMKEEIYVGFITAWTFETFIYVEHFAIDEKARNGGIGAKALKQFMELCKLPIVLEVELPQDEFSKRRIGFYERLGFRLNHHSYKQPPYRPGGEWLDLLLMTYGNLDLNDQYEVVKDTIHDKVYGYNKKRQNKYSTFFCYVLVFSYSAL